ncbi:hypothetical protein VTK73DRAFT_1234 [Phialemonium thermophilum]|uniref:Beta-xylosidase n=1 Tax=Phialemonium thermophilum TaxID=223376 RepID=A0ABR3Y390_9PEZI
MRQRSPRSVAARRTAANPVLAKKLRQLALPLAPLVQVTTGRVHDQFPRTLLAFWLLTESELDTLAVFYHQRDPGPWSSYYPCPVPWRSDAPLEVKRRRFGRFIGLRGCESPDHVGDGTATVSRWASPSRPDCRRQCPPNGEGATPVASYPPMHTTVNAGISHRRRYVFEGNRATITGIDDGVRTGEDRSLQQFSSSGGLGRLETDERLITETARRAREAATEEELFRRKMR